MQSRERLLTPLLKWFILALAHGTLENDDITLRMKCAVWSMSLKHQWLIRPTFHRRSGPRVLPLLWKEVKSHRGSSELGIQSPLETGVCLPGTPEAGSSVLGGTLRRSHCPANAAPCLQEEEKGGKSKYDFNKGRSSLISFIHYT